MKMTKSGMAIGAAAALCVVLQGCKAPKAQQEEYLGNEKTPAAVAEKPVTVTVDKPVVTVQPVVTPMEVPPAPEKVTPPVKPLPPPPAPEAEFTLYTVRNGDMLSKISKKFNVRQSAILAANPGLKANKLFIGRKIKIPGRHEIKEEPVNVVSVPRNAAPGRTRTPRAAYKPYTGATKEYTVKNGDFYGKIAAEYGISVRALKELNGATKNDLQIGRKIKVPAEKQVAAQKDAAKDAAKPVAAAPNAAAPAAATEAAKPAETVAPTAAEAAKPAETAMPAADKAAPAATDAAKPVADAPAPAAAAETAKPTTDTAVPAATEAAKPAEAAPTTHIVKAGEDIFSIAIHYHVSPSSIMDLNEINDKDALPVGKTLKLPPGARTAAK